MHAEVVVGGVIGGVVGGLAMRGVGVGTEDMGR